MYAYIADLVWFYSHDFPGVRPETYALSCDVCLDRLALNLCNDRKEEKLGVSRGIRAANFLDNCPLPGLWSTS